MTYLGQSKSNISIVTITYRPLGDVAAADSCSNYDYLMVSDETSY